MGNLIVKDNALVEASHRLGEVEQRLILLAILKARSVGDTVEQLKDKELIIHADDYIQTFGVDRSVAYKTLKKAVMGLYRAEWGYKHINSRGNTEVVYERFTQSAKYIENEATVKFMFANAIIPLLVELERRFTSYEIEQVAELSSSYSMRLYEFLIQKLDKKTSKGWLDISLVDLRFRFGLLPNEYERMDNFKRKILDYSISEINKHTDLTVTYAQKKRGRMIVGFRFDFECKKPKATAKKPSKSQEQDELTPRDDQERQIIAENNAYAAQIGATERHRKNLVRKTLREHREAQEQAEQAKKDQAEQARQEAKQEQLAKDKLEQEKQKILATFDADFAKLQAQAQDFVCANKHMITSGIERVALNNSDYAKILNFWVKKLQDPNERKQFNLKGFL